LPATGSGPPIRAADDAGIAVAARLIRAGVLVGFPTETVYGLGADATNDRAVAAIYAAKERPRFNPLIVHGARTEDLAALVDFDHRAHALARAFWPGPLTLVLARRRGCAVSLLCSAGLPSLAVRIPGGAAARRLIEAAGVPIAAPSANRSGQLSPTTAAHVAEGLGEGIALVLDGGPCPVGLESTVLDLTAATPAILRPGGVTAEAIATLIGAVRSEAPTPGADTFALKSPGQLPSHYAPGLPLRMNVRALAAREALLAFGPAPLAGAPETLNLSPTGDLTEAAANLFAMLHALDRPEFTGIAVMPVPETGLGRAINDRLRRAALPRS